MGPKQEKWWFMFVFLPGSTIEMFWNYRKKTFEYFTCYFLSFCCNLIYLEITSLAGYNVSVLKLLPRNLYKGLIAKFRRFITLECCFPNKLCQVRIMLESPNWNFSFCTTCTNRLDKTLSFTLIFDQSRKIARLARFASRKCSESLKLPIR